jgi:hypothetical protein
VNAGDRARPVRMGRTSPTAKAALICGIIEIAVPPAAIAAIILGHLATRGIRRSGEKGLGLAKAGLILGYIGLALGILAPLLVGLTSTGNH